MVGSYWPIAADVPEFVLHGPVVTEEWDNIWCGAREKTNNTGELTAMIELMIWLLEEAPDGGDTPVMIRFDSFYAANVCRGIWEVKSNEELAQKARAVTERVEERRILTWVHVYGHT